MLCLAKYNTAPEVVMQQIFADESLDHAVLDHIRDQFARESARYVAHIDAHRAAMRKHASRCGAAEPEPPLPLSNLLHETTALLELCVDLAGVQSAMLERQARSVRLIAQLIAGRCS